MHPNACDDSKSRHMGQLQIIGRAYICNSEVGHASFRKELPVASRMSLVFVLFSSFKN